MRFIRGLTNLRHFPGGCVVTIGNFDGMHLGHQRIVWQVVTHAKKLNLPSVAVIFEPQPREFFTPDTAPARLASLREKLKIFKRTEFDYVLCLKFNAALANQSPEDFIQQFLVKKLNVKYLVVGDNFRFGRQRLGNFAMLEQAGSRYGFSVDHTDTVLLDGARVSSTRVRDALSQGDFQLVRRLLGHAYNFWGRVARGDQRGQQLGFPTANIMLRKLHLPLHGVFVIKVHGLGASSVAGVANIGVRPTIGGTKKMLEAHLFDFNQDIYGKHIRVEFLHKIRDEQRFESLEALRHQIAKDVIVAKEFLEGL